LYIGVLGASMTEYRLKVDAEYKDMEDDTESIGKIEDILA
jgi:hypothetical protein